LLWDEAMKQVTDGIYRQLDAWRKWMLSGTELNDQLKELAHRMGTAVVNALNVIVHIIRTFPWRELMTGLKAAFTGWGEMNEAMKGTGRTAMSLGEIMFWLADSAYRMTLVIMGVIAIFRGWIGAFKLLWNTMKVSVKVIGAYIKAVLKAFGQMRDRLRKLFDGIRDALLLKFDSALEKMKGAFSLDMSEMADIAADFVDENGRLALLVEKSWVDGVEVMKNAFIGQGLEPMREAGGVFFEDVKKNWSDLSVKVDEDWKKLSEGFGEDAEKMAKKGGKAAKKTSEEFEKMQKNVLDSLLKMKKEYDNTMEGIMKKVDEIEGKMMELRVERAEEWMTEKEKLAKAYVDQEEKVANLEKGIAEETDENKKALLQQELDRELESLKTRMHLEEAFGTLINNERRRRQLSTFELFMEDFNKRTAIREIEFSHEMGLLNKELEAIEAEKKKEMELWQKAVDEIRKIMETHNVDFMIMMDERTNKVIVNLNTEISTLKILNEQIKQVSDSYARMRSNIVGGLGIPRFAEGGIVTQPTLAMVGEAGPEAIVPLNKRSGIMNRIMINITGNHIGSDYDVNRIGDLIIQKLNLNYRNF